MTEHAVLRIERGSLTDEELAALTAVLAARIAALRQASAPPAVRRVVGTRPAYHSPLSWQQAA
ncbi:acyl-CoA carboxylase epsilon subunit [Kitasatospora sp. GP82]|uniref:acyl-CoA carboxylase epsilon subunit n=1 Tax=Kitasatospora sp. GP82 TaxID=3035089 RepID=UPI0024750439|nr:acyl-CoA carboxylase epsilon subunit [Kitasatospora sp. GP82]MDH6129088.1 hypothetical protein [Kitasatospora sp. GP82]